MSHFSIELAAPLSRSPPPFPRVSHTKKRHSIDATHSSHLICALISSPLFSSPHLWKPGLNDAGILSLLLLLFVSNFYAKSDNTIENETGTLIIGVRLASL